VTAATGEYTYSFTQADEAPFSDAAFTHVTTETGRILSNVFRCAAGRAGFGEASYLYTGGTYDGGDVTAKIEVISTSSAGDDALAIICDENGDGYFLTVRGSLVAVDYTQDYGQTSTTSVGYNNSVTFTTGDVYGLTVTKGSPNTVAVTQNGSTVTMTVGGNTHSATLGTLKAGFGVNPNDTGSVTLGSFAADGLVTSSPVMMGAACW
jgi:hypothetical protein